MGWFQRVWRKRGDARAVEGHLAPAASGGVADETEQVTGHGIVMYGTPWCGDCRRAKRVFAEKGIAYTYVDIEDDPAATALVMRLNRGMRSVPTIIFPDGNVLVEPGNTELAEKLSGYIH